MTLEMLLVCAEYTKVQVPGSSVVLPSVEDTDLELGQVGFVSGIIFTGSESDFLTRITIIFVNFSSKRSNLSLITYRTVPYIFDISIQNLTKALKILQQYHLKLAIYLVGLVESVGSGFGRT